MKNIDKFRKALNKDGIITEFKSPTHWISTGNYALNFKLTGDFKRGLPNKRSFLYYGPKGSGKSYMLSLAAKHAQESGYDVFYIDTETASEENYMEKVGLDLSPERFTPIPIASVEDATKVMSELFKVLEPEDKTFVAIDSLSMMLSNKEMTDFEKGDMKGDQGQIAKKLKLFVKNINSKVGNFDMFVGMTGHTYLNQNLLNGKGEYIFSGGEGTEYIPSIAVLLKKLELKEDGTINGIRIKSKITKSRFNKYGGSIELTVPWDKGIDPYDGLIDIAEESGIITKSGAWYTYGEKKFQRKDFQNYINDIFDLDTEGEIVEDLET